MPEFELPYRKRFLSKHHSEKQNKLTLEELTHERCLVVLGDPGLGKTRLLRTFAADGKCEYLTVSQFLHRTITSLESKTLFLDGLDEARSQASDGATLEHVVGKLLDTNPDRVILSCRTIDWLDGSDLTELKDFSQPLILDLLPLTNDDIRAISQDGLEEKADQFWTGLVQRDLLDVVSNPQNLILYLEVFRNGGNWPDTKTELYSQAIQNLLRENNEKHKRAIGPADDSASLISIAEKIAASLILTGRTYFSARSETQVFEDELPLSSVPDLQSEDLSKLLARRLIIQHGDQRFGFPHRTIIEFLAGKYLANKVTNSGFPISRLVSVICGKDGKPPTDMRGLYAWLITLLPAHAATLLQADPYGAVVYGDPAHWSVNTCKTAWEQMTILNERNPYFDTAHGGTLIGLSRPTLASEISVALNTNEGMLQYFALRAVEDGNENPALGDTLLALAANKSIGGNRRRAVRAFARACPDRLPELASFLTQLKIEETNSGLLYVLQALFEALYPHHISVDELLDALVDDDNQSLADYGFYLTLHLPNQLSPEDLATFLHGFPDAVKLNEKHTYSSLGRCYGAVLCRTLTDLSIEPSDLWRWLKAARKGFGQSVLDKEHSEFIKQYIESQQGLASALFDEWLADEGQSISNGSLYQFRVATCWAKNPKNFRRVLLDEAGKEHNLERKSELLHLLCSETLAADFDDGDLSFEELWTLADTNTDIQNALTPLLTCNWSDHAKDHAVYKLEAKSRAAEGKAKNIATLSENLSEIRAGKGVGNLDFLAQVWLAHFSDVSSDMPPEERILDHTNEEITAAALEGFRAFVKSQDTIDVSEVVRAYKERSYPWAFFTLAIGLDLHFHKNENFDGIPEDTLLAGLAIKLMWDGWLTEQANFTSWHLDIIAQFPEKTKEILLELWSLRHQTEHFSPLGIEMLDRKDEVAELLQDSVLTFLSTTSDLSADAIKRMICATMKPKPIVDLNAAIDQIMQNSRDSAKHLVLAFGFAHDPDTYYDELQVALDGNPELIYDCINMCGSAANEMPTEQSIHFAGSSILLFGNAVAQEQEKLKPEEDDHTQYQLSAFIHSQSSNLAKSLHPEATAWFNRLIAENRLSYWHHHLLSDQAEQLQSLVDSEFDPMTPSQVFNFLGVGKPANHADLQSLVLYQLQDLQTRLLSAPTDGWKGYWNTDKHGKAKDRKIENLCRDETLDRIAQQLGLADVIISPESLVHGGNRADMMVYAGGIKLPIEAKRADHSELWKAAESQLHKKYTTTHGADGYGIYLVFWHGPEHVKSRGRSKPKPSTAVELKTALEETLSDDLQGHIKIFVLDVSEPD